MVGEKRQFICNRVEDRMTNVGHAVAAKGKLEVDLGLFFHLVCSIGGFRRPVGW